MDPRSLHQTWGHSLGMLTPNGPLLSSSMSPSSSLPPFEPSPGPHSRTPSGIPAGLSPGQPFHAPSNGHLSQQQSMHRPSGPLFSMSDGQVESGSFSPHPHPGGLHRANTFPSLPNGQGHMGVLPSTNLLYGLDPSTAIDLSDPRTPIFQPLQAPQTPHPLLGGPVAPDGLQHAGPWMEPAADKGPSNPSHPGHGPAVFSNPLQQFPPGNEIHPSPLHHSLQPMNGDYALGFSPLPPPLPSRAPTLPPSAPFLSSPAEAEANPPSRPASVRSVSSAQSAQSTSSNSSDVAVPAVPMPRDLEPDFTGVSPWEVSTERGAGVHNVVGTQGRRSTLPSDPEYLPVDEITEALARTNAVPDADKDGKYPCRHCPKLYLHAKHLKRHAMRHTGDRPYSCRLCLGTFTRSDILKKHFEKCSSRRGNPGGHGHLHNSRMHLAKPEPGLGERRPRGPPRQHLGPFLAAPSFHAQRFPVPGFTDPLSMNPLGDQSAIPGPVGFESSNAFLNEAVMVPQPNAMVVHQRSGFKRPNSAGGDGREARSLMGPGPSGSNRHSLDFAQLSVPVFGPAAGAQAMGGPPSSFLPRSQSTMALNHADASFMGHAVPGQSSGFHPMSAKVANTPFGVAGGGPMKREMQAHPSASLLMDDNVPNLSGFANWQLDRNHSATLSNKANALVKFCFQSGVDPNEPDDRHAGAMLRRCLSAVNVNHFIKLFGNFQGHWPVIHMPTFSFKDTYDGLLMTMVCIGTVYSDRLPAAQINWLMVRAKRAVYRTTRQIRGVPTGPRATANFVLPDKEPLPRRLAMEQMQALALLQILLTWHGDEAHRDEARKDFPGICRMLRREKFLEVPGVGQLGYSALHHQESPVRHLMNPASFDWKVWVEQEQRLRIIYNMYLLDTAMVVYFNTPPEFDSQELLIPLPADELVWDAPSARDCANALGLDGLAVQISVNRTGSRQQIQPQMAESVRGFLQLETPVPRCHTNVYSKFILVHAVHVQIWNAQRQYWRGRAMRRRDGSHGSGAEAPAAAASTQTHDSGIAMDDDGPSPPRATAPEKFTAAVVWSDIEPANALAHLRHLDGVLTKWKRSWDEDFALQYLQPISAPDQPPRRDAKAPCQRVGFGRDAVPFYWLARAFLKNTTHLGARMSPDQRLVTVLTLLKLVKQWVTVDTGRRGEPMGQVNDIDEGYGIEELTLDMKLFFTPLKDTKPDRAEASG